MLDGIADVLRTVGSSLAQREFYHARFRRQERSLSLRNEEGNRDAIPGVLEHQMQPPVLDFLVPVEKVCRVKSIEIISEGEH